MSMDSRFHARTPGIGPAADSLASAPIPHFRPARARVRAHAIDTVASRSPFRKPVARPPRFVYRARRFQRRFAIFPLARDSDGPLPQSALPIRTRSALVAANPESSAIPAAAIRQSSDLQRGFWERSGFFPIVSDRESRAIARGS